MDDKKTNPLNTPNNNSKDNINSDISKLTKEANEQQLQFGPTQSEDINKNLGSFTNNKNNFSNHNQDHQLKLEVDKNIIEKTSKEQLDFEKFSKTQRGNKQSKTKFGEKVSLFLRNKKGLILVWSIELISMVIFIIFSSLLISKLWPVSRYDQEGPIKAKNLFSLMKSGVIFCWIAIFPCAIPLIYLLTSWFVGINQVISSKIFHYLFFICLLISLICLIIGFGLNFWPLIEIWSWGSY